MQTGRTLESEEEDKDRCCEAKETLKKKQTAKAREGGRKEEGEMDRDRGR